MTRKAPKPPKEREEKSRQQAALPLQDFRKGWDAPEVTRHAAKAVRPFGATHSRVVNAADPRAESTHEENTAKETAPHNTEANEAKGERGAKAAKAQGGRSCDT